MDRVHGASARRALVRVMGLGLLLLAPLSGVMAQRADNTRPTAPTGLTATAASATQINLSWTRSTDNVGVTGYRIERCAGATCTNFAQFATTTTATTYSNTGLTVSTAYRYRVRANDAAGNLSNYSTIAAATTPADTTAPTAPGTLTATAISGTQINLSWTAATDNVAVTGYRIERCNGAGCTTFAQVATTTTAVTYNNTGLSNAMSYRYRVRATDAAGNVGGYSPIATAVTLDTMAPAAPSGLTVNVVSSTQLNLSWTAATDNVAVTGYRIERCSGVTCTTFAQVATTTTSLAYSDTALAASTAYSYRVRATDAAGNLSAYSNITSAATSAPPDTQAPMAPTALTATAASGTQVNLSWTASTDNVGVTAYLVERCTGTGCTAYTQIGNAVSTTYGDVGLTNGTSYSYRVRASDAANNLSPYTSQATVATLDTTAPTAPTSLTSSAASGTQVNLSWSAATDNVGVTGYRIERCSGASCSSFAQIATTSASTYNDTGLTDATSYSYRIRATDAAGNLGAYSNVTSTATLDATAPTVPSNLFVGTQTTSQIDIGWLVSTDNVGVTGYLGERGSGAGCTTFTQVATTTMGFYSDTNLTTATNYSYRVCAMDAAGNLSGYSATVTGSSADTVPPSVPADLTAGGISGQQINLSWSASIDNLGVTGYVIERCQGTGCTAYVQVATATVTSYSDLGLIGSTSYSYRLRATDAAGNLSDYSTVAIANTTDSEPPSIPAGVAAIAISSTEIHVSWSAATDNVAVTGYFLDRCVGAGCTAFTTITDLVGNSYRDTGLSSSTSYSYRLRAMDAAGNVSDSSNIATAQTQYAGPISITYQYDSLGRVIQASGSDGSLVFYQYDANGNVTTIVRQ